MSRGSHTEASAVTLAGARMDLRATRPPVAAEGAPEAGTPEVAAEPGTPDWAEPGMPEVAVQPRAAPKVRVLVGSNDPFTRRALRVGASGPDIEVLADGTVTSVAEQLAAQLNPDIVLLDVQTEAAYALRAIQRIRLHVAGAKILACSAPAAMEFGMLCLNAGAWGYVSKEIDLAVLPGILRALARGEAVIPRQLATELVRRFAETNASDQGAPAELSPPECRLLDLLRTGCTLSEAAAEIGVTLATARRHLGSARRKVSVPPPAE